MTPVIAHDPRTRREAVIDAHIRAEAIDHNVDATLATFREPGYYVPAMGGAVNGAAAVSRLLSDLLRAFPDFRVERKATYHSEDAVIIEVQFGGTHMGEWVGIAASGKPMSVDACCIFVFDGADLLCEKIYFDHATVLAQLR
jgi:steroid delta-isomerase-like uncharacterized protein